MSVDAEPEAREQTLEESSDASFPVDVDAPETTLRAGSRIADRYRVIESLGHGGMGAIWAAEDEETGATCAIKVQRTPLASRPRAVSRFLREAELLGAIASEHVVRVLGAGRDVNGTPYLVMERLSGEDLRRVLDRRGKLPADEAVRLAHEAALGLFEAHRAGVVHRDVKPSNLFLAERGGAPPIVKLVDFGIARRPDENVELTATGEALGSPRYMSPEQVRNAKDVDARTDVWSLGVTLYELLTGALPFEGTSASALSAAIVADEPVPLRARAPELPAALERVVGTCLAKDRAARFSSAELLAELASLQRELAGDAPVRDAAAGEAGAPAQSATKKRWAPALLAVGAALLGALGLGALRGPSPSPSAAIPTAASAPLDGRTESAHAESTASRPVDPVASAAPAATAQAATTTAAAASVISATTSGARVVQPSAARVASAATSSSAASVAPPPKASSSALVAGPLDDRK